MDKPEALRLADACDLGYPLEEDARQAAAELRRLHEANEAFGKRQEWWNERMFVLEQQRDALLEAFSLLRVECHQLHHNFKDRHTMLEPCPVVARINAAIKKAEENT